MAGLIETLVGGASGTPAFVSSDAPVPVTNVGSTSSSASTTGGVPFNFRLPTSAATNNNAVIKASQGQVYFIVAYNTNAAVRFLKLYNKATAPAPATDTPVVSLPIPPTGGIAIEIGLGANLFPLGIGFALVTGAADNDNTAVGAADILGVNIGFS